MSKMDKEVIALKRARKAFEQVFPECFQSGEHQFIQNEIPTASALLASAIMNTTTTEVPVAPSELKEGEQVEETTQPKKDAKEYLIEQPSVREMIKAAKENIRFFKDDWQLRFINNMAEKVAEVEETGGELRLTDQQIHYIERHYGIVQKALKNQQKLE